MDRLLGSPYASLVVEPSGEDHMRKILAGGVAALAVVAFAGPALACMGMSQQTVMTDSKTNTQTAEAPQTPKPADRK